MRYVIGCDLGSQTLKAVLWSEAGEVVGTWAEPYPIEYPRPAWAEQDTAHWWRALAKAIPALLEQSGVRPEQVAALGLDGTVDGFVPVGQDGQALGPHIMWMDRRAVAECDWIAERIDPRRLFHITGLNLDATHTAAKILWLRNHQPAVYERAWMFMPSTSYAVYWLTGECVVDYSNASSSMIFDVHRRAWSDELLRLLDLDAGRLPPIRAATDVAGALTERAAGVLGLRPGTPVVVGCGDEHASCVGAGVMRPGIVGDIIGTAEPVCLSADEPVFDATQLVETHCHAHPERWLVENPGFVSGGNLRWLRDTLIGSDGGEEAYDRLIDEAAAVPPGSQGVTFLPAMMGAMAPEWNSNARGVFYGLTLAHTRGHLVRAALEGAVYGLRSIVESMQRSGLDVQEIRAVGGGCQSRLIRQIRADVTGLPVMLLSTVETTAVGAALLAAVGVGLDDDLERASARTTQVVETIEPDATHRALYEAGYAEFLDVYHSLKASFDRSAARRHPGPT